MVVDKATQQHIQQQLSAKAEGQGYLLYDDILALIPEAEHNLDLVEEVIDSLTQLGVPILIEPPSESAEPPHAAELALDEDLAELAELASWSLI